MMFLPVPKIMQWQPSLDQHYQTSASTLITSGCSFTASTLQIETPASWPGYMKDRCGFNSCIDYSYPGAGNSYIGDSILHHFDTVSDQESSKYFVVIMWSGIDRIEKCINDSDKQPRLGDICYQRIKERTTCNQEEKIQLSQQSAEKIIEVYNYLINRKIAFVFTFYSNLLFPPFIPKRDTTFEFENYLNKNLLKELKLLNWIPKDPMNFLYEYAFTHNYLDQGDYFHPPVECNLEWTDQILLPEICKQGLIHELLL